MQANKSVHKLVLDSGAILRNEPPVDTLLARSEKLYTVPSVLSEIRDAGARARLENLIKPFLEVQKPSSQSLQAVVDFAKKSGDFSGLSRTDLEILALTYELDVRLTGAKNHLRQLPGQRLSTSNVQPQERNPESTSISSRAKQRSENVTTKAADSASAADQSPDQPPLTFQIDRKSPTQEVSDRPVDAFRVTPVNQDQTSSLPAKNKEDTKSTDDEVKYLANELEDVHIAFPSDSPPSKQETTTEQIPRSSIRSPTESLQPKDNDSEQEDEEGWITPSNLRKHQMKGTNGSKALEAEPFQIGVACLTTDYAMQNVLLQIGLSLVSSSLQRIRNIRTYILRCHACFQQVKDTSKQFCPRCGGATLTRVSCSTDAKGVFRIHLKKNMQWNHRGDRYSIPKPIPGSANGKVKQGKGGGKGGWGQDLILTEDQKEYQRAVNSSGSRMKAKDLMDEDYLPSILTGDRSRPGGRPKVGAGRNVNSKKRI